MKVSLAHRLIADVARATGQRPKACQKAVRQDGLDTPAGHLTAEGSAFFLRDAKRCSCVVKHFAADGEPFFVVEFGCQYCRGQGWVPCAGPDAQLLAEVLA
ncbi:hypothetical protein ASF71_14985 [Deinococcus sp. Leaf326]|nr:hypothetical protein ASF71_14985 [Deinococcus sp. Leaf326]